MFRIVKKSEITTRESIVIRGISIIFAFALVGIFIQLIHLDALKVYSSMIKGAFGSSYSVKETIIKAIPLIVTSLGISIAFKMQFWNIGGEGQIIMGAFLSSYLALKLPETSPVILLPVMFLAGCIGGAVWAYIPAYFKSSWGTNETIVTLMMNYIALKFVTYLQYGPLRDPKAQGLPKISTFSDNAILPNIFGIHIGWIIALVLVVFIYLFMNYMKKGYEISVLGESENTAMYAGVNIKKTIIISMLLSGGLCGIAGMIQASAVSNTLSVEVSGGVGYTAIIIAWLSNLSAPLIVVVSILFAALLEGGSFIQTAFGIPESAALILQATILFFVLGSEFFIRYKVIKNSNASVKVVT
ncbi:ABC transporter permease [Clostridium rectalis]|uniref:ABC transporter permease n=1 Tax=Clostridium rectalis TaxID=2040295 RepID=UPI000F63F7E9|nr:ABC transporter permease [Clostridium rectalis]